jgi:hypothetical protein
MPHISTVVKPRHQSQTGFVKTTIEIHGSTPARTPGRRRHNRLNTIGEIPLTHSGTPRILPPVWPQPLDHVGEHEQIGHPERRSPSGYDYKGICRDDVGPTGRNLPQPAGVVVEIDAMTSPAVARRDEPVLPPEQRMVRMRDPEGVRRRSGIGCS